MSTRLATEEDMSRPYSAHGEENGLRRSSSSSLAEGSEVIIPEVSRGVRRMEHLERRLNNKYRALLYGGFTLLAYVMSLDQYTASTYDTTATSTAFAAHSLVATIATIKSVCQAVSQPPIAKISDVAGRVETYILCVLLYAIGYAIAVSSRTIYQYAVGQSVYIFGITGLFLLQNIIIADISSTRNRLFWSIFPSIPGCINVWVSGEVASSVLSTTTWRWGMGMFCILVPAMATPIILTLGYGMRAHKKDRDGVPTYGDDSTLTEHGGVNRSIAQNRGWKKKAVGIFWSIDLVGLILLVAGAGMVLVTITLANSGSSRWKDPHCIALLTVGGVCCIAFVLWERFGARHPLIPFTLLTNRTVIVALVIAIIQPAAAGAINSYFYTFLVVAANQSVASATRISQIASFSETLTAAAMGLLCRYIRRLKPIIVAGMCIDVLAFGLMIRYRQSNNSQGDLAMVQVVRGIGSGCIGFPVQSAIQSVARHEHVAAITAGYLTFFYLAGGIGSSIGGGIWTNLVPGKIDAYMNDPTLASEAYADPIDFITRYLPGTPQRAALARAQDETQRIIVITATGIAALGLFASLFLENVKLNDKQSLVEDQLSEDPAGIARNTSEKLPQAPLKTADEG